MFKNNLTPPPKKSPSQMFKPNATADGATMNVIIWVHDFPSQNPF